MACKRGQIPLAFDWAETCPTWRSSCQSLNWFGWHAGAETDPSDTINEIIFSTRKVRCALFQGIAYMLWMSLGLCYSRLHRSAPALSCDHSDHQGLYQHSWFFRP